MENKLWHTNKLICGDNLGELTKLPKESVDLIYIDPPFFTHRQYEVIWGDEAEVRSFEDRWEGGIEHYISWLKPRVQAMYEVLKPTGSFYLHCDWHANAYIKIMLDEIFGGKNFRNEIVWCYSTSGRGKREFSKKHDIIFFYSKTDNYFWNEKEVSIPYSNEYIKSHFKNKDKNGKICRKRFDAGKWRIYYPDEGMIPNDWWEIPYVNSMAKERVGYPTQKPEALLERIIKASSKKGNVVLDGFCGCGTALAVAQKLGRKWIGIDISPTAIKIIERRLAKTLHTVKDINYISIGMPTTIKELKELKPFEFQNWVIDEMRANQSRKKVGDMGLDGYYPKSVLTESAGIQVKQSDGVGRNVVDNFETALKRAKYKKGYIIAFSFSKGAYEEVARAKNKEGLDIKLITVEELLSKKKPII